MQSSTHTKDWDMPPMHKSWMMSRTGLPRASRKHASQGIHLAAFISRMLAADVGRSWLTTRCLLAAGKDLKNCQVSHLCNIWCQFCSKHLAAVLFMSAFETANCRLLQQSNSRPSWHRKASAQRACWRSRSFLRVLSEHCEPCSRGNQRYRL